MTQAVTQRRMCQGQFIAAEQSTSCAPHGPGQLPGFPLSARSHGAAPGEAARYSCGEPHYRWPLQAARPRSARERGRHHRAARCSRRTEGDSPDGGRPLRRLPKRSRATPPAPPPCRAPKATSRSAHAHRPLGKGAAGVKRQRRLEPIGKNFHLLLSDCWQFSFQILDCKIDCELPTAVDLRNCRIGKRQKDAEKGIYPANYI